MYLIFGYEECLIRIHNFPVSNSFLFPFLSRWFDQFCYSSIKGKTPSASYRYCIGLRSTEAGYSLMPALNLRHDRAALQVFQLARTKAAPLPGFT